MTQIRRGFGGDGLGGERLPWLEPVEEEVDQDEGGNAGRAVVIGLAVLAAIALIVAAVVWIRGSRAETADVGTVIRAEQGPYKVRPSNPGGMEIASAGAIAERTGVGGDIDSPIDLAALPEEPVTVGAPPPAETAPAAPAAVAPAPAPTPRPATPKAVPATTSAAAAIPATPKPLLPPKPAPVVAPPPAPAAEVPARGGTIQLGAFSTEAKANSVWKTLSKRFGALESLGMQVIPVKSGDTTLYRLRASGAGAGKVCAQLKVAGENCAVVG